MNAPSPDPLHGLDPADLMAAAAMPTDDGADTLPITPLDLPTLEEITAAFPDLEVLSLIGHGGMSAVFKARQPKLDRTVALKVLPQSLAATPGFAERFTREGRVLARLSHPSIVAVHDFGESGGFCYLLMEYVDGVNLRQAMRAGRFTPEQALSIIPAICDALQFAHTQGVLHRDIKPENILLDSRGKVKIADFGIAKILDEKGGDAMLLTQSGARLGTAPYMAPEQIEQPSSVDHRADIYSLGVVFYEMLTGELPLGRFAAPSTLSSVGGNIDEIVFRALEKERSRRQQSVDEFKTQVEGAGGVRPAPSPIVQHEKRLWLLALSMVLPCFVLFWVWQRWQQMVEEHSRFYLIEVPVAISLAGVAMYLVAVPLWLRMIGRNRLYGLRTHATMATDDYWFQANAHAGKKLFEWSISIIIAGLAGFYQLPRHQPSYLLAVPAFTISAVIVVLTSCWWWLRHHPVSGPARKESRLAKVGGKTVIAVIVALFIKSFILQPYLIPAGNEPGVAKGSHWIASKLDNGFSTGNLVVYEHDNGQPWIARVERREPDGLVLKRGGKPETFFVNWDKVIGKMLFSHFTPDGTRAEIQNDSRMTTWLGDDWPRSAHEMRALNQKPALLYTRLKLNKTEWQWPVYTPDGKPVEDSVSRAVIDAPHVGRLDSKVSHPDCCLMQLWLAHPDFDKLSSLNLEVSLADGSPLPTAPRSCTGMSAGPFFSGDQHPTNIQSVIIRSGLRNSLPQALRLTLRYTLGPVQGEIQLGKNDPKLLNQLRDGCIFTSLSETEEKRTELKWNSNSKDRRWFIKAYTPKSGWISSLRSMSSDENGSVEFGARLSEIERFVICYRDSQTVVFDDVVVPPLPQEDGASSVKTLPHVEKASAKALQQKPELRFTRIKINNTAWRWPVYAPDGVSVDDTVSQPLISRSEVTDKEAEDAEACWLQLWFEHPDFDPHSLMQVRIESLTGQSIIPVPQTQSMTHAPEIWSDQPTPPLHSVTISLGRRDSLPREIRVTLEYTIGPWEEGNRVSADFSGFMSFRHGGELAGLGENNQGEAFLSWTKPVNEWQTQVLAHRKDGTWLSPNGSSSSTKENRSITNFTFKTGFDTVDGFRTRARKIQTVVWDRVILPLLPPDEKPFNPSNGVSAQTSDSKDFQLITLPGPSGDGSYLALDQKPELVFTQIKLGQQTVPPLTIYKPDGSLHEEPLSPAIMKALIQHPFSFGGSAKDTCLFQLCFYHPEFDRNSGLQMQVTAADGTPLQFPPGHGADIMGPHFKFWEEVSYQSFAFSPGVRGKLPKSARVTLRYCIGPAKERFTVRKDARVGLPLGAGCQLNGVGETDGKYAFISWSNQDDARRYFVAALSKKDTWIDPANEVYSSANVQADFHVPLKEIESFHCGYRTYQTVVFENVVIPPLLDEDEPSMVYLVSGAEKNGPLPYKDGMTIWRAIQWCGGVSVRGAQLHKTRLIRNGKTISLNLSEGSKDRDFKLEPEDQIIIPE